MYLLFYIFQPLSHHPILSSRPSCRPLAHWTRSLLLFHNLCLFDFFMKRVIGVMASLRHTSRTLTGVLCITYIIKGEPLTNLRLCQRRNVDIFKPTEIVPKSKLGGNVVIVSVSIRPKLFVWSISSLERRQQPKQLYYFHQGLSLRYSLALYLLNLRDNCVNCRNKRIR